MNQSQSHQFNAVTARLEGKNLIEASAGTGKTFSLMQLVVRLIVEKQLSIERILLVTFTRAATSELSSRIRDRLTDLEQTLGQTPEQQARSEWSVLFASWRAQGIGMQDVQARVGRALARIDDACVLTIHGFCQKMLSDLAFSNAGLFDAQIGDDTQEKAQVIEEFLRQHAASLSVENATDLIEGENWQDKLTQLAARPGNDADVMYFFDDPTLYAPAQPPKSRSRGKTERNPMGEAEPLNEPVKACLREFVQWAPERLAQLKQQARLRTYDDLLTQMQQQVTDSPGFAQAVRALFDAVLIDEFQDTDPLQYSIFNTLFLRNNPSCTVFFVGDPKQSIYSFRAAELDIYFLAKQRDIGAPLALGKNYRSTPALVASINAFFSDAGKPGPVFMTDQIQCAPVDSDSCRLPLLEHRADGTWRTVPAFELWTHASDTGYHSTESLRDSQAEAIAADIASLLTRPVYLGERRVVASDIALLVRARSQAQATIEALARRGYRVRTRNDEDVFGSVEAQEILAVLQVFEQPKSVALLTTARATRLFGETLSEIRGDEQRHLQARLLIERCLHLWQVAGVAAAFSALLTHCQTVNRLLALASGERMLMNYSHIIELLHAQSSRLRTISGLTRWFVKQMHQSGPCPDERRVRVESDAELIQVETIHSSKGLAYPIVYLPQSEKLSPSAGKKALQTIYRFVDAQGRSQMRLAHKARARSTVEFAQRAELAENVRLAYVAMTRATSRLVLPLYHKAKKQGWSKTTCNTAYWHALTGMTEFTLEQGIEAVRALVHTLEPQAAQWGADLAVGARAVTPSNGAVWQVTDFVRIHYVGAVDKPAVPGSAAAVPTVARVVPAELGVDAAQRQPRCWTQTSFSKLARTIDPLAEVQTPSAADDESQAGDQQGDGEADPSDTNAAIHHFPRGTRAGDCLHQLLEKLIKRDKVAWALSPAADLESWVSQFMQGFEGLFTAQNRAECVHATAQMVRDVFGAELVPAVRLADVPVAQCHSEMEFLLSVPTQARALGAPELGRVLSAFDPMYSIAGFTDQQMHGYLTGAVDLVFEADGRYWIADWKSNSVAPSASGYHQQALAQKMTQSHYRLQYLLYLVALVRLLRVRLGRQDVYGLVGGAIYVFLRGVRADEPLNAQGERNGVYFDRPAEELIDSLDALLLNGFDAVALERSVARYRARLLKEQL